MDSDKPGKGFTRMISQLRSKEALIEEAVQLLDHPDQRRLLRRLYAHVSAHDLEALSAREMAAAAAAAWEHGSQRRPGKPRISAGNPEGARHSVVQIVNDDMPFLVDSATAELNRLGFAVHLVIHPVLELRRDRVGKLVQLFDPQTAPADAQRESWMRIEFDQTADRARLNQVEARLDLVLADVRAAVEDWKPMLAALATIQWELEREPPALPSRAVNEARDFLRWLTEDNFTFLGYREYRLAGSGESAGFDVVEGSGLGLLRSPDFHVFEGGRDMTSLPPEVREFLTAPRLLTVNKANVRSTVHRRVHLDVVSIKSFDAAGAVAGDRLLVGLFTSMVYIRSPRNIPLLRAKIERVLAGADLPRGGHDWKGLENILLTYPRDELFQIGEEDLSRIARGILELQERQRIALFLRFDPFKRFVSALVYVPRERHSTELRQAFQAILEAELAGRVIAYYTTMSDESVSARVHFVIRIEPDSAPEVDEARIEARLMEAGRTWQERLRVALVEAHGEEKGLALLARHGRAFPVGYTHAGDPAMALADLARVDEALASGQLQMNLRAGAGIDEFRFRLYRPGAPIGLSDVLPMLEAMGLRVLGEDQHVVRPEGGGAVTGGAVTGGAVTGGAVISGAMTGGAVWLHDFALKARRPPAKPLADLTETFHAAFARIWSGAAESDGFNALVLAAGLGWREISVLRAYAKYLRQIGAPFTQASIEEALAQNGPIARLLAELFLIRIGAAAGEEAGARHAVEAALESVASLEEDRILRRLLNLIGATLRCNYRQREPGGEPRPALAFKLDCRAVDELPTPRPLYEIWVYSPRVEGVHLRFGKVARGGIRWSDRRDDFRTEILGLVKTQTVKNAVIVPVGAKGGFVLKQPPQGGGREALQAEGVACYQIFIRALLDITDNVKDGRIVPPRDVTRHDGDDAYLVVAADKGTATFSDIANAISTEYGHWLGDAFASGGSAGYDHKAMAITARGVWVAVQRHFRELGHDTQSQDFTVIGVGDMSGDVFGNGMLQSPHIRLLAAFDHRHIFLDPDPDAAASFAERKRLFALPRSSWADYDCKLISPGGGVLERTQKAIKPSPEARRRFGLEKETFSPPELIRALLGAEADLLYFGGIGTYVKAAEERHQEAGDRANDGLRVDGRQLRARVVAEGANLALTQAGRVEYARLGAGGGGGKINTDAIDNSAGVDCSDHEVNIKILLAQPSARGRLSLERRNKLLAEMTEEVAALVLRDNYLQTACLSVTELVAPAMLGRHARFIKALERAGRLDRAVEGLPDEEALAERQAAGAGLARPELAILLAYAKIALQERLVDSDLPDDPQLEGDLLRYFPEPLRKPFKDAARTHQLRREIVATLVTNSVVNRAGITFAQELETETGLPPADIARGYVMSRDAFELRELWAGIEALDGRIADLEQRRVLLEIGRFLKRGTSWFLRYAERPLDMARTIGRYRPMLARLAAELPQLLDPTAASALAARAESARRAGFPDPVADRLAALPLSIELAEVVRLGSSLGRTPLHAAKVYFPAGTRFGLDWLRDAAAAQDDTAKGHWDKMAIAAIVDDLYSHQYALAASMLGNEGGKGMERWLAPRAALAARIDRLLEELKAVGTAPDLAMLAVANRELRTLVGG